MATLGFIVPSRDTLGELDSGTLYGEALADYQAVFMPRALT